tara:strand:+ start:793 stop:1458 length:666 start_codon:yes stop_codon:yes gene_type:complete
MGKSKIETDVGKFLKHKYVIVGISILAIINIFAYIMVNKTIALLVFALVGILTNFFTKDISSILIVSMLITNLFLTNKIVREGLENSSDSSSDSSSSSDTTPSETKDITDADNVEGDHPVAEKIKEKVEEKKEKDENDSSEDPEPTDATSSAKTQVDQYATTEEAYKNLESMIGSGGLKNLSKETKELMTTQKGMIENMKSMRPLIAQAQELLKTMNGQKK